MTRRERTVIIVCAVFMAIALFAFFMSSGDRKKEEVIAFFDDNNAMLLETARQLTDGTITPKSAVKKICRSTDVEKDHITISDKKSLDIYLGGFGIVPAGADYGLVYLPTNNMKDFQWWTDEHKPYTKEGKGYYTDDGTDNSIYLEELKDHWYYYYVTF
ncbi:MAG: hypothetical protein Q4A48_04890 [Bacillota bacterium]|nr:hypothetical protein [Bacillota bacterium]